MKVQHGVATLGSSSYKIDRVTVEFDDAFTSQPSVVATPLQDPGWHGQIDDTFAVTVTDVSTSGFRAQVMRLDRSNGWGQNLKLTWVASAPL